jgi:ATPase subunit of ABC transporter with duplicated ATPase domains
MAQSGGTGRSSDVRPLVQAREVTWRTPTNHTILDRLTFSVGEEKIGLVGPNGSGKSTLARLLAGHLKPTSGSVRLDARVAYLPQDFAPNPGDTLARLLGVEDKLTALRRLADGTGGADDLAALDGDWSAEADAARARDRVGLTHLPFDRVLGSLSGGETTRAILASLLFRDPDLLILDEPTNHLDREARQALYKVLRDWRGGLLVVSHDRALLGLVDKIVALTPHGLRVHGGGFDQYLADVEAEAVAARRELTEAEKQLRKNRREAQAVRERQERRASRGKKMRDRTGMPAMLLNAMREKSEHTSARLRETGQVKVAAAQDALAAARERVAERPELNIALAPVEFPRGKNVFAFEDVWFRYPGADKDVVRGFTLRVFGPERVALVGPNGCGKSTLLRLLAGELEPTRGRVEVGAARMHFLDQRTELLRTERSVLENFRAHDPRLTETACRLMLARFLFREEMVHRPAGNLSGGERLRAALACVLTATSPPQLLILDEPNNHLDLDSLANLEQALRGYTGALLVVSHDDTFLDNIRITRRVGLPALPAAASC